MAPTEGRFARPERRWDCRRGTPVDWVKQSFVIFDNGALCDVSIIANDR